MTLEAQDSQLIMRFHTIDVFSEDEEEAMNNIAYRNFTALAYKYDFTIKNMRRGGSTLPKRDGKLSTVINTFGLSWNIEAPKKTIDESVLKLLQASINVSDYDIQLMHQFVIAKSEIDSVSRFIFLYNLALQLHSDSQKKLDESILIIKPSCTITKSPRNAGNETIYTRLRNQVAHNRKSTNIEKTRKEIENVVNDFQEMVLKMLPDIKY